MKASGRRPLQAGRAAEWEQIKRQIRADHYRKTGFIAAFEARAVPKTVGQ